MCTGRLVRHGHRRGSGVQLVELSLRRSSTGLYWNGSSFGTSTETFRPTTRTGSAWRLSFSAGSFPADGGYVVTVRGVDVAGNVTTATPRSFTIDTVPPSTTITAAPAAVTSSSSASFSFTSSETGSSFACRVDGAAYQACTSPKVYTGLAVGVHSFNVVATDPAGQPGSHSGVAFLAGGDAAERDAHGAGLGCNRFCDRAGDRERH